MRLRLAGPGRPRSWSVAAPRGVTLGALAELAGFGRGAFVAVDGWVLPATCPLESAGLVEGALLSPAAAPTGSSLELVVAADAPGGGRRVPLVPGRMTVGRHPANDLCLVDPEVHARHADVVLTSHGEVRVTLVGDDSARPLVLGVGDELVLGTTRLCIAVGATSPVGAPRTGEPDAPVGSPPAVVALRNRPPRPAPAPWPVAPTRAPDPAAPSRGASLRTLATMLVPALAGVALAAAMRPDFLALALLAPAGALVTWLVLRALDAHAAREHRSAVLAIDTAHAAACRAAAAAHHEALLIRHPHLDAVATRVVTHDVRLWERRPAHDDFLRVPAGLGAVRCDALAADEGTIVAPVELDLRAPIGIVGEGEAARALARALVLHVVAHHGPADVSIRAWTTDPCAWQWLTWLPHAPHLAVCSTTDAVEDDVRDAAGSSPGARTFVVVDANGLPAAWRPAWRGVLDGGAPIVIAPSPHELPEQCRVVVHVDDGTATVHDLATGERTFVHDPWTSDTERAQALAARLAPLRDPDAETARQMAHAAGLLTLLDHHGGDDADALRAVVTERWAAARRSGRAAAPIGTSADGPLVVDLDADGPHALVAGTTGAGKSELLRSVVLGFAASVDPQHLAFVLVDYKGGSAFDGLHALPHVVDVVTDLDASAADRARRGLDAEVLRREHLLRAAGVSDLAGYHAAAGADDEPLPRLVIVVDEFATLAQELSSFVDALVDVAQRGRSLGIHLVLATQRPSGAVKDSIRTNTNLRIALRVLDAHDSRDVIGVDDAATIPRRSHGRAIARLGAGDLRTFQSAYTGGPVAATEPDRLRMTPLGLPPTAAPEGTRRELDLIVRAVTDAHRANGGPAPRRPWTDPLPSPLPCSAIPTAACTSGLVLGLLDDPEAQLHRAYTWATGNVLVAGLAGSGASEVIGACIASAVDRAAAERPHIYVIAANVVRHEWAAGRPEVGAVVAIADDERVTRLLRMLSEWVDARRRGPTTEDRDVVVLVDGIGALRAAFDTVAGIEVLERLERLAADGPGVSVRFAFVADHPGDLGHRLDRTVSQRTFLRLGDRADYVGIGRRDIDPATLPHGRGVDVATGHTVQLAHLDPAASAALEHQSSIESSGLERGVAPPVGALPVTVERAAIGQPVIEACGALHLPLGIGDDRLVPVGVRLGAGEHLLVAGGPRRAKSTLLATIRRTLDDAGIATVVIGTSRTPLVGAICDRAAIAATIDALLAPPAPLDHAEPSSTIIDATATGSVGCRARPVVVLVDDADAVDDGGALERLIAAGPPQVHVIAAARTDRLRPLLRHWTAELRRGGTAVLLRGDDADADLVGVRLPRNVTVRGVGRGWLVRDGEVERCQFALDLDDRPDGLSSHHHTEKDAA